jgi:DNA mismatch repair protein MutL
MGKIQIMDEWLSNKIAAGEVVERPASVVKELVENAIDAGSTSVEVFLEEAGLSYIQVIDNGSGMDEEDARKSFARHATSKIEKEQDLFRIRTLGFRGEALASIASVSKLTLRTSDGESGLELYLEGGHIREEKPAPLRKGTDIKVAQLFYNTPARLKYLKTVQTELSHTIDFLNRIALGYPEIAIKLVHNGQTLLHTNGRGNVQQVLAAVYGNYNAQKMIPFQGENNDYKVHGYATKPEVTRASKNYISLFVNGRWVKHFLVQKAIIDAYHTYLPIERFPIVVLYIEVDPQLTDVNVHPAKHQVRLSKEPELLTLIEESINEAIRATARVPLAEKKEKAPRVPSEQLNIWKQPQPTFNEHKLNEITQKLAEQNQSTSSISNQRNYTVEKPLVYPTIQEKSSVPTHVNEALSSMANQQLEAYEVASPVQQQPAISPSPSVLNNSFAKAPEEVEYDLHHEALETPANSTSPVEETSEKFPQLEVVGQIHGTYIVAQMEDGFYLIDQHAAQERIKYEYYKEKVGDVNPNERQALLLPLTFHYAADEALKLMENKHALEEVGVYLEEFGQSSFVVREYPTWFPKAQEQEIIEDLIEQVLKSRKADIKKLREDAAIMMSCKKSIKANHYLTKEQMERLLNDLREADNPFTCPHGRPVLIHFSSYEVEKMFKRVM